jgi:sarcosine oxidase
MRSPEVVVIGLGAMGSATLYQLAKAGVHALGIDQFQPPHNRGSSHGETRITRLALGEGEAYVPLVKRSHEIWRELESATGSSLLHQVGGLIFAGSNGRKAAHGAEDFLKTTCEVAAKHQIQHERLTTDEMSERFPQFKFHSGESGYYEPEAGYVRPEACIQAQLDQARILGAGIRFNESFHSWRKDGEGFCIKTDQCTYRTERIVLTAGPWIGKLVPEWQPVTRTYRQLLHWFQTDGPKDMFSPENMPIFIRVPDATHSMFYGFPELGGSGKGLKIAGEQFDIPCNPDLLDKTVTSEETQTMFESASTHLRIRAKCIRSVACQYTVTPDFGFLIDHHPENNKVWIASPCSGHGFKHSAGIGEVLSKALTENTTPDTLSPFQWRFGEETK